jgi:tRNA(Ile)-lysidine synthase
MQTDFLELPGGNLPKTAKKSVRLASDTVFPAASLAAVFRPWEKTRGIVLGVSGGPDSVALMLLAAEWVRGCAAPPLLYVATVDHGLRNESRGEAEKVASWATALGLPHAILAWAGTKPESRIQERAREARYNLLAQYAGRVGAYHVMTAHHADDQAETILFRLLRGSGIPGLAGMQGSSERNGVILVRPLLNFTKTELLAVCESKGHPFIRDPSNHDPAYARTRLRQLDGFFADKGLDRNALIRLGRRAARADAALAQRTLAVTAALEARRELGIFSADISALAAEPEEIILRFLADELKLINGGKPIRLDRLESLAHSVHRALRSGTPLRATLGGAVFRLHSGGSFVIRREPLRRRVPENLPVRGGAGCDLKC